MARLPFQNDETCHHQQRQTRRHGRDASRYQRITSPQWNHARHCFAPLTKMTWAGPFGGYKVPRSPTPPRQNLGCACIREYQVTTTGAFDGKTNHKNILMHSQMVIRGITNSLKCKLLFEILKRRCINVKWTYIGFVWLVINISWGSSITSSLRENANGSWRKAYSITTRKNMFNLGWIWDVT